MLNNNILNLENPLNTFYLGQDLCTFHGPGSRILALWSSEWLTAYDNQFASFNSLSINRVLVLEMYSTQHVPSTRYRLDCQYRYHLTKGLFTRECAGPRHHHHHHLPSNQPTNQPFVTLTSFATARSSSCLSTVCQCFPRPPTRPTLAKTSHSAAPALCVPALSTPACKQASTSIPQNSGHLLFFLFMLISAEELSFLVFSELYCIGRR